MPKCLAMASDEIDLVKVNTAGLYCTGKFFA
jgi:hypothetical protein